jgi:hypothetical protein
MAGMICDKVYELSSILIGYIDCIIRSRGAGNREFEQDNEVRKQRRT